MNTGPTEPFTSTFGAIPRPEEPARWPDPPPPPRYAPPVANATVINNIRMSSSGGYLRGHRCNHLLHATLTVLSCGLWAPIWLAAWLMGRRR